MAYDYRIDSWNKEVAAKEKQETTEQGHSNHQAWLKPNTFEPWITHTKYHYINQHIYK